MEDDELGVEACGEERAAAHAAPTCATAFGRRARGARPRLTVHVEAHSLLKRLVLSSEARGAGGAHCSAQRGE